jgi:hypothetical protein
MSNCVHLCVYFESSSTGWMDVLLGVYPTNLPSTCSNAIHPHPSRLRHLVGRFMVTLVTLILVLKEFVWPCLAWKVDALPAALSHGGAGLMWHGESAPIMPDCCLRC